MFDTIYRGQAMKNEFIGLRMSTEDRKIIEELAKRFGSISEAVRRAVVALAKQPEQNSLKPA
jgi:hypothetical protein